MGGSGILSDVFGLQGEVAVVTGAYGKLGPIWIETLLDGGASVLAVDRPDFPMSESYRNIRSRIGEDRLREGRADVRDRAALERVSEDCVDTFGIPTVLVNNAGIDRPPDHVGKGHTLECIPFEENREIFEVNTLGPFLVAQVFGARMAKAGYGSIVNIGSLYASVSPDARFYDHIRSDPPFLKPPAYGASKAAVVNLTKYLATAWARHGIRVNTLSPGGVLGEQDEEFKGKFCDRVPMGRMATASDLRGPLLFLASRASSYVTGIDLVVDGGFTAW